MLETFKLTKVPRLIGTAASKCSKRASGLNSFYNLVHYHPIVAAQPQVTIRLVNHHHGHVPTALMHAYGNYSTFRSIFRFFPTHLGTKVVVFFGRQQTVPSSVAELSFQRNNVT